MNGKLQRAIFASACLASIAGGIHCGRSRGTGIAAASIQLQSGNHGVAEEARVIQTIQESGLNGDPSSKAIALKRAMASCETEALWTWLADKNNGGIAERNAAILELIDRLGWKAWDTAMAIEDPEQRERLGNLLLWGYSERDPWRAYELWKQEHGKYEDSEWGIAAYGGAVGEATKISADKLVEILNELPDLPEENSVWLLNVEFSSDFNFETALEWLLDRNPQPRLIPDSLLKGWSQRSPAEAAAWLAAHPEVLEIEHLADDAAMCFNTFFSEEQSDSGLAATLKAIDDLPPAFVDELWDYTSNFNDGKLDATTLEAADQMGRRESFLTKSLLQTRFQDQPDASWELVPLDERRHLIDLAAQSWAEDARTPVDERTRAHWKKGLYQSWGLKP